MRRIRLLALLLFLFACTKNEKPEESNVNPDLCDNKSQNITLDHAARLISQFLKHQDFADVGKKVAIGGTLEAQHTKLDRTRHKGLLFWYRLQNNKFFVTAERRMVPYTFDKEISTLGNSLVIPNETFTYSFINTGIDSVKKFILNHKGLSNSTIITDTMDVYNDKESFKRKYSANHCKYPYAYFERDSTPVMDNFFNRNLYAVRYYFGYDCNVEYNKIRLIIMTVDRNGTVKIDCMRDGGGGIVDSSWPPPPPASKKI